MKYNRKLEQINNYYFIMPDTEEAYEQLLKEIAELEDTSQNTVQNV